MAITNQERVGKALELLRAGLAPFAEREFRARDPYLPRLARRALALFPSAPAATTS